MDYVVFETENERFGLPAHAVAEVLNDVQVRHIAGMPDHIAGVVLLRGRWLPAIDAAVRLGLHKRDKRAAALVIKRGAGRFVLTADAVLGIRGWPDDSDVIKTDIGLVTPINPDALFHNELQLAGEEEVMSGKTSTTTIVVFRMGGEEFGTEIGNVVEVLEYREPVRVPKAPAFLEGVIYLREEILPVIDLRKRLEIAQAPATADTRYLVVVIDGERVALQVDAVVEVAHLRGEELADPPAFFRGVAAEYLHGLGKVGERVVIVLRVDRILSSQERIALLRADYKED